MRTRATIIAGVLLTATTVIYTHVRKLDDGYIIETMNGAIDPVGEAKLAFTRATRDCNAVKSVDHGEIMVALAASRLENLDAAATAKPRAGWKEDGWMLVETDFESLEPAILLLKRDASSYKVASIYGGTAAPFNDVQAIHSYFTQLSGDAPRSLIDCYEPVGPPFDRAS